MQEKKEKQGFVMYNSFLEAAEEFSEEELNGNDFREYILMLRDYAMYGLEKKSENNAVNALFKIAKPNLNASVKRYEQCIENGTKGAEFGKLGGRPRKGETKEEYQKRKEGENPNKTPNRGIIETPLNINEKTPIKPLNINNNINNKENININNKENKNNIHPSPTPSTQDELNEIKKKICSRCECIAKHYNGVALIYPLQNPEAFYSTTVAMIMRAFEVDTDKAKYWCDKKIIEYENKLREVS